MNRVLTDDGIGIGWTESGSASGPALLLSNSLGTDRGMWTANLAALERRYRVIRYDSRGHGLSDAPPGEYSLPQLAADALAVLDAAGVDRAHVAGVSLGGMIAQWLGVHRPARVDRLVLANTAAWMGPAEAWNDRIEAVRTHGMASIAESVADRWFTAGFRQANPVETGRMLETLRSTDPTGYAGCCAAIRDMDHRELLDRVSAPVLVIGGLNDPSTPAEKAEELASRIAGAGLAMLPAAHLSNIEQSEAFSRLVLEFLEA